jgi:flagellar hook-associated protein 1 FlgK
MDRFFNAVHDMANDPTSAPARQVVISEAESLVQQFKSIDSQFDDLNTSVNQQLEVITRDVNDLATSIADLNEQIVIATGATGNQPNDLLDQRDVLVKRLAEYVDVSTVQNDDNSVNVYIGNGQSLVLNNTANSLELTNSLFNPTQKEIALKTPAATVNISEQLTGGKIRGLLDVREEVINQGKTALGQIAMVLSSTFNTQHQAGDDLNGNPGGLFFSDVQSTAPTSQPSTNNDPTSGTISVTVTNASQVQASDYRLNYDGTNFSLTRLSDNTVVDSGFTTADLPRAVASEGLSLSLSGTVAAGDSFLISPTRDAVDQLQVNLSDPATLAAAASGNPEGDNSNALALAALQNQNTMNGGSSSFMDAYGEMVTDIGIKTHQARVNGDAQKALLNQAIEMRESISGVNLDEEAANLLKFQQAYQASAQVITIANSVFQSLINAVSR